MGVSWSSSENDDPSSENNILNKDTLIYMFEFLGGSLDELVSISIVNRYWASLIGGKVIPTVISKLHLKAWYHQESIKSLKTGNGAEICGAWHASPKANEYLINSFPFPKTLKSRVPSSDSSSNDSTSTSTPLVGPWSAYSAKGGEPRVVKSKSGKKSLQFVNLNGLHPVHLRTALFDTQLKQPVTIICVGIAFEDATFISGIDNRFEVCHSYPNPNNDLRAPVSITAHPVGDSSDSDDDPSPSCIVSGNTQPGEWHVYTAVFNEDSSELYVDGRREGTKHSHSNVGIGCLDGLTIGADHRNDFPLGSTVESSIPGVIAELVVFGSVLKDADRQRIERKLMVEHGIALPSKERDVERKLTLQAHNMLMERAGTGKEHPLCPLKYLARHNDVSWSIQHPVTGDKIRPKRIGVRETAESSGWDD